MRIFVRIVDASSFTRAAESLEIPRATATTTVQALESLLGVQLLVRTTRKVTLTAEGAAYYERCAQILAAIEEVESGLIQPGRAAAAPYLASRQLVEVLPKCKPTPVAVSVTYVKSRQISPRVRAFVDWLAEVFDDAPGMVKVAPPLADPPLWPVLDAQRPNELNTASH